jgi:ring-1,2-phenylacetyl-CoA epoxidase subunit PaaD
MAKRSVSWSRKCSICSVPIPDFDGDGDMNNSSAKPAGEFDFQQVWSWLSAVPDPEIPVLSIVDLGIIRGVTVGPDRVEVEVSPTYSGCPATEVIETSIVECLRDHGVSDVALKRVLSPPWTTAWITAEGREKLREYGIAPPAKASAKGSLFAADRPVACPRCNAVETTLVSDFGSTPCKASYRCTHCLEPFEYFKCL